MTFETEAVDTFLENKEQAMGKLAEMAVFFLKEQKAKRKKVTISAAYAHIKTAKKDDYKIPYVSSR